LAPSTNVTTAPASTVLVVGGVSVTIPDNVNVARATPVPDTAMVLVPLAWLPVTVILPVYACAAVGVNVTVTTCDPFGAMVPLAKLPLKPAGYVTLVMVSSPLPVLAIVSDAVAALPTVMLPKVMLPLNAMVDVGVGAVGVSLLQPDRITSAAQPAEQSSSRMRD
jgi:hypothetical protein